jgi:hypothetical protein
MGEAPYNDYNEIKIDENHLEYARNHVDDVERYRERNRQAPGTEWIRRVTKGEGESLDHSSVEYSASGSFLPVPKYVRSVA